jgi:hypothetical protein
LKELRALRASSPLVIHGKLPSNQERADADPRMQRMIERFAPK